MTTPAEQHYERLLAAHYTWMTGGDVAAAAEGQAELLRGLGVAPVPSGPSGSSPAVGLGSGPGAQTLALAALGFSPVVAVDTSQALLADAARALVPGGRLVVSYRDPTRPLEGTDRFLPVRGDADRILTCFLEYLDADTVRVHDLLHLRTSDGWTLHTGSYPKLRIAADWLADRCREAGLQVSHDGVGPRGMRVLVATRPA
ncbi:class I SAM-dependent methyltransferase [Streptomyces sparsogenes]|uniref:class I SAM-dependent methyltransferase n=1 Tax=Streptomyces sparsogenes TaxID=67365 RepID=UPI00340F7097